MAPVVLVGTRCRTGLVGRGVQTNLRRHLQRAARAATHLATADLDGHLLGYRPAALATAQAAKMRRAAAGLAMRMKAHDLPGCGRQTGCIYHTSVSEEAPTLPALAKSRAATALRMHQAACVPMEMAIPCSAVPMPWEFKGVPKRLGRGSDKLAWLRAQFAGAHVRLGPRDGEAKDRLRWRATSLVSTRSAQRSGPGAMATVIRAAGPAPRRDSRPYGSGWRSASAKA